MRLYRQRFKALARKPGPNLEGSGACQVSIKEACTASDPVAIAIKANEWHKQQVRLAGHRLFGYADAVPAVHDQVVNVPVAEPHGERGRVVFEYWQRKACAPAA